MHGEGSVAGIVAALNEEEDVGPTITEWRQFVEKPWVLVVDTNSRARAAMLGESSGSSNLNAGALFLSVFWMIYFKLGNSASVRLSLKSVSRHEYSEDSASGMKVYLGSSVAVWTGSFGCSFGYYGYHEMQVWKRP
jgi:hypothetical protein